LGRIGIELKEYCLRLRCVASSEHQSSLGARLSIETEVQRTISERLFHLLLVVFIFYFMAGILAFAMHSISSSRPLRGIIPPMVTPLDCADSLDRAGLERLIEHMIAGGVHGIFILGTTGEGPALSYRLRRELIDRTCAQVAGRVPVLVCISDTAYEESRTLAAHAKLAGADAVVTAPPFYFEVSQNDLFRLVQQLSSQVELPLYLYNMPSRTKVWFAPETVLRAADLPNVWGLKDSSGELDYLRSIVTLMRNRPEFTILMGPEDLLLDSLQIGAHGGVCGGANLFPRLFVSLYEAARAGDLLAAVQLQQRVRQMGELLYGIGEAESSYIRGLKLGLELLGICSSTLAPPSISADPGKFDALREVLKEYA
jgi:dihydrodipicolinate synthase/N-acetylneuraminate lyase